MHFVCCVLRVIGCTLVLRAARCVRNRQADDLSLLHSFIHANFARFQRTLVTHSRLAELKLLALAHAREPPTPRAAAAAQSLAQQSSSAATAANAEVLESSPPSAVPFATCHAARCAPRGVSCSAAVAGPHGAHYRRRAARKG